MSRRKVEVKCRYCNIEFETVLRWEGLPEKEYCSGECETSDEFDDFGEETFEKFEKAVRDNEW